MVYVLENNGVYCLTKGQFSASADLGSTSKGGAANRQVPIDPVTVALSLGASFVARSFSGDKEQLVPILKAAILHDGFAFLDVISPCVTFNDHRGSTKSYAHTREHMHEVIETDFVPLRAEITTDYAEGTVRAVTMHDGSVVKLRKVDEGYDPSDRHHVIDYVWETASRGEIATGLLFIEESNDDMHGLAQTTDTPLVELPHETPLPGQRSARRPPEGVALEPTLRAEERVERENDHCREEHRQGDSHPAPRPLPLDLAGCGR